MSSRQPHHHHHTYLPGEPRSTCQTPMEKIGTDLRRAHPVDDMCSSSSYICFARASLHPQWGLYGVLIVAVYFRVECSSSTGAQSPIRTLYYDRSKSMDSICIPIDITPAPPSPAPACISQVPRLHMPPAIPNHKPYRKIRANKFSSQSNQSPAQHLPTTTTTATSCSTTAGRPAAKSKNSRTSTRNKRRKNFTRALHPIPPFLCCREPGRNPYE